MKNLKLVILATIAISILAPPSYAGCWHECLIPKLTGGCAKKVKVCDLENPSHAVYVTGTDFMNQSVSIWHDVYGVFPEWARDIFNEHGAELIGFYFGGLTGAALGEAMDQIYGTVEKTAQYAKTANEVNAPEYVSIALTRIGHSAAIAKTHIGEYYGETSKQAAAAYTQVDQLQDQFSKKILTAGSEEEVKALVKEFRKQLQNATDQ